VYRGWWDQGGVEVTPRRGWCLTAETVEGTALALECVDNVHGSDSLSAGVLGVGDRITDHVLEKDLEDTACLLIDEAGDTLDTSTASETTDGRLGDALDVVTKDLPVTLGTSLAESAEYGRVSVRPKSMPEGRLDSRN
jgi:hypothetical protein